MVRARVRLCWVADTPRRTSLALVQEPTSVRWLPSLLEVPAGVLECRTPWLSYTCTVATTMTEQAASQWLKTCDRGHKEYLTRAQAMEAGLEKRRSGPAHPERWRVVRSAACESFCSEGDDDDAAAAGAEEENDDDGGTDGFENARLRALYRGEFLAQTWRVTIHSVVKDSARFAIVAMHGVSLRDYRAGTRHRARPCIESLRAFADVWAPPTAATFMRAVHAAVRQRIASSSSSSSSGGSGAATPRLRDLLPVDLGAASPDVAVLRGIAVCKLSSQALSLFPYFRLEHIMRLRPKHVTVVRALARKHPVAFLCHDALHEAMHRKCLVSQHVVARMPPLRVGAWMRFVETFGRTLDAPSQTVLDQCRAHGVDDVEARLAAWRWRAEVWRDGTSSLRREQDLSGAAAAASSSSRSNAPIEASTLERAFVRFGMDGAHGVPAFGARFLDKTVERFMDGNVRVTFDTHGGAPSTTRLEHCIAVIQHFERAWEAPDRFVVVAPNEHIMLALADQYGSVLVNVLPAVLRTASPGTPVHIVVVAADLMSLADAAHLRACTKQRHELQSNDDEEDRILLNGRRGRGAPRPGAFGCDWWPELVQRTPRGLQHRWRVPLRDGVAGTSAERLRRLVCRLWRARRLEDDATLMGDVEHADVLEEDETAFADVLARLQARPASEDPTIFVVGRGGASAARRFDVPLPSGARRFDGNFIEPGMRLFLRDTGVVVVARSCGVFVHRHLVTTPKVSCRDPIAVVSYQYRTQDAASNRLSNNDHYGCCGCTARQVLRPVNHDIADGHVVPIGAYRGSTVASSVLVCTPDTTARDVALYAEVAATDATVLLTDGLSRLDFARLLTRPCRHNTRRRRR